MRKLLYISLIALASCTPPLVPQPPTPPPPGDLANYFWPMNIDTSLQYQTTDPSGHVVAQHKIALSGTNIFDVSNGQTGTFTVNQTNGTSSITGFSSFDIFGFDPSMLIVSDTVLPAAVPVPVRSIATFSTHSKPTQTFALSDSAIYTIDNSQHLDLVGSFLPGFTLSEDLESQYLFAYQSGGNAILYSVDPVDNFWTPLVQPVPINVFTSTPYYSDLCWFASSNMVYRVSSGSNNPTTLAATLSSNVVALAAAYDGVYALTSDGKLYDINRNGTTPKVLVNVPGNPTGIVTVGFGTFIGSSYGLFSLSSNDTLATLTTKPILSVYTTGYSFFATTVDSVLHYLSNGTLYGEYPNPSTGSVSQFAKSTNSSSGAVFALTGSSTFYLNPPTWSAIDQSVAPPWQPVPGALTLLKDGDSSWTAGYLASFRNGTLRFFAYHATSSGPYAKYSLNSSQYSNILIVHYTPMSNGVGDHDDAPEFLIYYQKGFGPIRIERTEGNNTTATQIVK